LYNHQVNDAWLVLSLYLPLSLVVFTANFVLMFAPYRVAPGPATSAAAAAVATEATAAAAAR